MLKDGRMTNRGGRPLRAGVKRAQATLYMLPDQADHIKGLSKQLGLTYTDTLTYLVSKGAGLELPAYIRDALRSTEDANYSQPLIA